MALITKETFRVGIDHNIAKSTAFISNQQNQPVESIDIRMLDKTIKKLKVFSLKIQRCGYYLDNQRIVRSQIIHEEEIELSSGEIDFIKRADIIARTVTEFLKKFEEEKTTKFTRVALEDYARRSLSDKFKIAEVTGILKLYLRKNNFNDIFLIPPTSLKSFIAEFGHADKEVIAEAMLLKLGFTLANDDLNDSFLLSIFEKKEKIDGNKKGTRTNKKLSSNSDTRGLPICGAN